MAQSAQTVFLGTFAHCPSSGQLEILEDHLLAVDSLGFISHLQPLSDASSDAVLSSFSGRRVDLARGSFIMPTFTDLHIHAPQYLYAGTGLDEPLMTWLERYAFCAEERIDGDASLARLVYKRLARRMVECGTSAALIFGTIKEESNLILARTFLETGLRGYVGKLSMNANSKESYIEVSAEASLAAASSFIRAVKAITHDVPPHLRLVHPVITPRFVPTCDDALLVGLGELAKREDVRIQSHMCEARDQVEWVRSTRNAEDEDVFARSGLLTSSTTQAHCTFMTHERIAQVASRGTSIASCPLSNSYFSSKIFPMRKCLDANIAVGLGSDIAGGYQLDLLVQQRQAVIASRHLDSLHKEDAIARRDSTSLSEDLRIDWKTALYLATRGGALALKAPGVGGRLQVGESFDAQLIQLLEPGTVLGTGALDFFDLEVGGSVEMLEMIERWWCVGDVRNRKGVWVQGRRLM